MISIDQSSTTERTSARLSRPLAASPALLDPHDPFSFTDSFTPLSLAHLTRLARNRPLVNHHSRPCSSSLPRFPVRSRIPHRVNWTDSPRADGQHVGTLVLPCLPLSASHTWPGPKSPRLDYHSSQVLLKHGRPCLLETLCSLTPPVKFHPSLAYPCWTRIRVSARTRQTL